MAVNIETFPVYPLGCNCSIVYCSESKEAIVIDPGGSESAIISFLSSKALSVKYILHTHAHFDHCMGTKKIASAYENSKVCLHKEDIFLYNNLEKQCRMFGFAYNDKEHEIDHFLEDNELIQWGIDSKLEVVHTPGHTPGSLCLQLNTGNEQIVFSGDTLFAGSIGRTDLWGGDYGQIISSIKNRLLILEDETKVIPGHGEKTVIYNEKRYNPYLV